MKHPSDDELILHYYGESDAPGWMRDHLQECETCRDAFDEVSQVLALTREDPIPERAEDYGAQVWRRLEPRLPDARERRVWIRWPGWVLVAAAATAVVLLFQPPPDTTVPTTRTSVDRNAVLRLEVASHLEHSERFLLEAMNGELPEQTEWAEELLRSNRLLQQMARSRNVDDVGGVLEELEMTLTEAAHPEIDSGEMYFDGREMLFRVRAVSARLGNQEVMYANAF